MGEINTFLLGVITVLLSIQTGVAVMYIKQTNANSKAITKILTRCSIFHGKNGDTPNKRFTDAQQI